MALTPGQKNILRRMLYEGLVIVFDYERAYLAKPWKWDNEGEVQVEDLNCLISYGCGYLEFQSNFHKNQYYNYYYIGYMCSSEEANTSLVERAKTAIEKKAEEYEPKDSLYFLVFVDKAANYVEEVKTEEINAVCEDCINGAVEKYKKQWEEDNCYTEEGIVDVGYDEECSGEHDDFAYCMECGEIISCGMILSQQELDYWLEERDPGDYSPQDCYMLAKIFEHHTYNPDITPRIEELARKVLKEMGENERNVKNK